jgi:hypothetical protein
MARIGSVLAHDQPLEAWAEQACMNWRVEAAYVRFAARGAVSMPFAHSQSKRCFIAASLAIVS